MPALQNTPALALLALVDAATITPDASQADAFSVTLGGNRTLANPVGMRPNQHLRFFIKQDATGSRLLTYGTAFKWPSATAPTLSTVAARSDMLSGYTPDGVNIYMGTALNHVGF